jgi:general secretion pathway protein D
MPLDQFLMEIYGKVSGRTVLRPSSLPDVKVTLTTETPLTKRELIQAFDTVLALNNITMIPMGDKFVEAVPATEALKEGAALSKVNPKDLPEASRFVTQIVQLTNALPTEVMPVLTPLAKIQNGIVAIDSSQTLVLRDYAPNVKRMLEVIEKIDVVPQNDYKLEVIPIKYGKVADIYVVMGDLISSGGTSGGTRPGGTAAGRGGASRTGRNRTTGVGGARSSNLRTMGTSANSPYGATGPGGMLNQPNQPTTAAAAAAAANQPSFRDRLASIVRTATGGGSEQLLANARIIPDDRSNSLVVYATRDDMVVLTNMVAKLDVLLAQVLIDAIIVDVNLEKSVNFGISAAGSKNSGAWSSSSGMNNGQGFLSSITNFPGSLPSGFSYFGKYNSDLDVAFQALASDTSANILQRPRIQTTHAVPATFINGKTVPYVTGTYSYGYGYGPTTSYSQLTVGIELSVTPYITPDDLVVMEISQSIDDIAGYTKIDNNDVPITTTRSADATVSVHNGDTIILGGFIRQEKTGSISGVPLLKDIPLLGNLFRSTSKGNKRSELIVFLRPTVLNSAQEAANLATTERKSLPGVSATEKMFQEEEKKQIEQFRKK